MTLRVLLDSTYILPAFGISVKGLEEKDLEALERLRVQRKVRFYYVPVIWVELVPKVVKEYQSRGVPVKPSIFERVALALENTAERVDPTPQALALAARLRILGHRDMIDNILYAVAVEGNMLLLTMDERFREFLHDHGFDVTCVVNHRQLLKYVKP